MRAGVAQFESSPGRRLASLLPIAAALAQAACAAETPETAGDAAASDPPPPVFDRAFIVPPGRLIPAGELAAAVRATGYRFEAVTGMSQLELGGRPLDNYRLDCEDRSYLVTWLDGGTRIKPWSEDIPAQ